MSGIHSMFPEFSIWTDSEAMFKGEALTLAACSWRSFSSNKALARCLTSATSFNADSCTASISVNAVCAVWASAEASATSFLRASHLMVQHEWTNVWTMDYFPHWKPIQSSDYCHIACLCIKRPGLECKLVLLLTYLLCILASTLLSTRQACPLHSILSIVPSSQSCVLTCAH